MKSSRQSDTISVSVLTALCLAAISTRAVGEDNDLRDLDVSAWPCLNRPEGTAKTPDGLERNPQKARPILDLAGRQIEGLDTAAFRNKVSQYDAQLTATKRSQLNNAQKAKLKQFESQIVSLTGYLVLAYPGPPETTNCADANFHDWHLELFEKSSDHHPQPGDPTPIICEVTPRTEQLVYRSGVRLRQLSGFFRHGKQYSSSGHPPQFVRVTGYLMWDDEHNGTADIGDWVQYITPGNGFHHPWRSSAWEIHPVLQIEKAGEAGISLVAPAIQRPTTPAPTASASPPVEVTLTTPVEITIPYGKTTLPVGMKLPLVSRTSDSVTVRYMGGNYAVPIGSTDLMR